MKTSPIDSPVSLWSTVLQAMLASPVMWEQRTFRASLEVQYKGKGLAVMAAQPRPSRRQRSGYEWTAWRRCRVFADRGGGPSRTLDEWIAAISHEHGADADGSFTCVEELVVDELAWRARRLRSPDGEEELSFRVGAGDRRPGWLVDRPPLNIPHFREMLDPGLVLSAVEFNSVTDEGDGWTISGRPRPEERSHGYYPAIVHPYGDAWTARIDRRWGSITRCGTTLKGTQLAYHSMAIELPG